MHLACRSSNDKFKVNKVKCKTMLLIRKHGLCLLWFVDWDNFWTVFARQLVTVDGSLLYSVSNEFNYEVEITFPWVIGDNAESSNNVIKVSFYLKSKTLSLLLV